MHKLAIVLLLFSGTQIVAQPYNPVIDVQHYDFYLDLNDSNNIIHGVAAITLEFKQPAAEFTFDLTKKTEDGKGMTVGGVSLEDGKIKFPFTQTAQKLIIHDGGAPGEKKNVLDLL
jgi:hypothetical protein